MGGGGGVGDWMGDGMAVWGGGRGVELHTQKLVKEILRKFC